MNFKEPTLSQTDDRDLKGSYQRAQMLLQGLRTQNLVQNDNLQPRWIDKTDCFWYPRFTKDKSVPSIKTEYRLVDAVTLTNKPAFDHCALTQALAKATEREVNAQNLPISAIVISLSPSTVTFTAFDQRWQFDCNSQTCTAVDNSTSQSTIAMGETLSPDGKQIAFTRDNNLWVRDVGEWRRTRV